MAEKQLHTIKLDGVTVEYDANALKRWSVQKKIARSLSDPQKGAYEAYEAYDVILCGKSDEVAEKLGDDGEKMAELVQRIVAVVGGDAKN